MRTASESSGGTFDLDGKRGALAALETEMADPSFWNNQERARDVVQQAKLLKTWVEPFDKLDGRVRSAIEMDALLEADPDPDMIAEVERETADVRTAVDAFKLKSFMQGPDDYRDA